LNDGTYLYIKNFSFLNNEIGQFSWLPMDKALLYEQFMFVI